MKLISLTKENLAYITLNIKLPYTLLEKAKNIRIIKKILKNFISKEIK